MELTDDIDRFACLHCGSEWLVNRSGGIASLKAVEDKLEDVVSATKDIIEELKAGKSKEAILREEQLRVEAREEIKKQKEEEERQRYAKEERIRKLKAAEEARIRDLNEAKEKHINDLKDDEEHKKLFVAFCVATTIVVVVAIVLIGVAHKISAP